MNLPVRVSIITICLISWANPASSQSSPWEAENEAGHKAYSLGHYAEAQKNYLAAIDDAKQSAGDDPQIVTPLNNLAALYMQQGRYSDAEQLYLQALSIRNNMSASEDSGTVIILSNLGLFISRKVNIRKRSRSVKERWTFERNCIPPKIIKEAPF